MAKTGTCISKYNNVFSFLSLWCTPCLPQGYLYHAGCPVQLHWCRAAQRRQQLCLHQRKSPAGSGRGPWQLLPTSFAVGLHQFLVLREHMHHSSSSYRRTWLCCKHYYQFTQRHKAEHVTPSDSSFLFTGKHGLANYFSAITLLLGQKHCHFTLRHGSEHVANRNQELTRDCFEGHCQQEADSPEKTNCTHKLPS